MSKRKKHSGNLKKQTKAKKEILQLEDCSKNDECGKPYLPILRHREQERGML